MPSKAKSKTVGTFGFFALVAAAFIFLVVWLIGVVTGVGIDTELSGWMVQPVSQLKVWHLLVMLFFTAILASD